MKNYMITLYNWTTLNSGLAAKVYQLKQTGKRKSPAEDSANRQKLIFDIQEGETGRRPGATRHRD